MVSTLTPEEGVIWSMQRLTGLGLSPGRSGNTSIRGKKGEFYIKPTGVVAGDLGVAKIPYVYLGGGPNPVGLIPSSEWPFHEAIYRSRPDVGAIVHCHSNWATLLAATRCGISGNIHYHSQFFGGNICCTPNFELPGSSALAESIVLALENRKGCLIANHGQLTVGQTIEEAVELAELLEQLAFFHWNLMSTGVKHKPIPKKDLDAVTDGIKEYGKQKK